MTNLTSLAEQLVTHAAKAGIMLTCAESCTGGMVAAALTDISGASAVLDRGFVTYSNEAKMDLLGVKDTTLEAFGAVSAETAAEMAAGALAAAPNTSAAIAITGVAGPGGGSAKKPVGLVWFGLALKGAPTVTQRQLFTGDRAAIRQQAAQRALSMLLKALEN